MKIEIKCTGVTRCCRQVMLKKMHNKEAPFDDIFKISLIPANYLGYKTAQIFVNDIDIGFIPRKETKYLQYGFLPLSVRCSVRLSSTGKPYYSFFLSGFLSLYNHNSSLQI